MAPLISGRTGAFVRSVVALRYSSSTSLDAALSPSAPPAIVVSARHPHHVVDVNVKGRADFVSELMHGQVVWIMWVGMWVGGCCVWKCPSCKVTGLYVGVLYVCLQVNMFLIYVRTHTYRTPILPQPKALSSASL